MTTAGSSLQIAKPWQPDFNVLKNTALEIKFAQEADDPFF